MSYLIPNYVSAMALVELGDLDGGLDAVSAARSSDERRGALAQLPLSYSIAGLIHYHAGRFDEAMAELEAGAAVVEDTGNLNYVLYSDSISTRIAVRRGDFEAAAALLAVGMEKLSAGGSQFGADWLLDNQTQYLVATGDLEAAIDMAEFTWSQTESIRYFYGYRERGIVATRLALVCGRTDFARTVADRLEEGSRRSPTVSGQAYARQARGLVEGNAQLLGEAAEMFGRTPFRIALAECREDAANVLSTDGHRDEAIAMLKAAEAIHSAAGTAADLDRVDATLRALGTKRASTRPKRPTFGWDSLTPKELDVSQLVAEGLTNPEIGSRLHISRRTVETHLAHVFRKLDFVSRTQLASEFTRRIQPS